MKRKQGFKKEESGYSAELANEYVMGSKPFVYCGMYPEVRYAYENNQYNRDKILSVKYWVYQNIEELGEDGKQNPFLVKIETDKLEDMPFGTNVTFEDLQACVITRKFGSDTYFKAKSLKKVGK